MSTPRLVPLLVFALTAGLLAAADRPAASNPLRLPDPPKLPEIKLHVRQPALPDLKNLAGEHGPSYAPPTDRFVGLFTPLRTDRAALSPDGKYLAYSVREADTVSIVVVEVDHPGKATARVVVATDATSTPMLADNQREKTPAVVRWLRWTTPTRVVVDTNAAFAIGVGSTWSTRTGAVFAFDADGTHGRTLVTPRDVLEQAVSDATLVPPEARNPHQIWSADQPVPTATANSSSSLGSDDASPFTPPALSGPEQASTATAQDIRVLDLAPDRPGCILIQSTGNPRSTGTRRVGAYLLDTVTGKLTDATDDIVPGLHQGLADRAGHVRLTLPVSLLTPFPHSYAYLGTTGANFSRDLDKVFPANNPHAVGFAISPENFFGQRAIPLGFDDNPTVFYFASNAGRNTFGVYSIDLATGQPGPFTLEDPSYDLAPPIDTFGRSDELIYDRFYHRLAGVRFDAALGTARWIYPSFQEVQKTLQSALPGHSVDIIEWSESGSRFLVRATAPGDAGAFYVFDREGNRLSEFVRRAPWIDANQTHKTYPFTVPSDAGLPLTALMTIPNRPRLTPMPVVLLCPELPWLRVRPDFTDRVQALADMGFLVVQVNGRGAWGFGAKHRAALAAGYDLVQVEDLAITLGHVKKNYNVDPKRIAVMGTSHGGFIALRALQLHPELFRCAVVLNTPVDLAGWLEDQRWSEGAASPALTRQALGDAARLKEAPLVRHPELVTKPVLFLHYGGPDGAPRGSTYLAAKSFAAAVRRAGGSAEFLDLTTDYTRGYPQARSDAYQQVEDFLNVTIYDFKVKMGELKTKPDQPAKP